MTDRRFQDGRMDVRCPDCGRTEAWGTFCSKCQHPYTEADGIPHPPGGDPRLGGRPSEKSLCQLGEIIPAETPRRRIGRESYASRCGRFRPS